MLTENDYQLAADLLKCEVAAVKAVKQVESLGGGFLPNGDIKLLFEPHIFYRELQALKITPVISDICYPKWKRGAYGKQSAQMGRLVRAMAINETAALKSASYGLFQILGDNHLKAGYKTVQEMVEDYKKGEGNQLKSFATYLINTNIDDSLRAKDWAKFALQYNGKGYKQNKYDTKLADAYTSFLV